MDSSEIRKQFLTFFERHQHEIVPSSPLLPKTDPSLLFVNAGMNQFKEFFLQEKLPPYSRAASCQKCLRCGGKHNDIDNVGHTTRHLTFFEMLGNFSFGDYYKEQAIDFAWQMSTQIFGMNPKRIFVSVLRGDDVTNRLWTKWLPKDHIWILDEADNFWSMGSTGPCGPCSELYYDIVDPGTSLSLPHEERFLEFWNIVFMQYNRNADGVRTPLESCCIDTGIGLERLCTILQKVPSVFETDLMKGIIVQVEKLSGKSYSPNDIKNAAPFRIIADHLRAISFAIAEGIHPGNTQRGYIIRKLIRRALQQGKILGLNFPFLGQIVPALENTMGPHYQELGKNRSRILEILEQESTGFFHTLQKSSQIMETMLEKESQRATFNGVLPGSIAFKLKDTYGLPFDEIVLLAKEYSLVVDAEGFQREEEIAKQRSEIHFKTQQASTKEKIEQRTVFLGYEALENCSNIKAIASDSVILEKISCNQPGSLVVEETVFYPKKGGQIGDRGLITTETGVFHVEKTLLQDDGYIHHIGSVISGTIKCGSSAHLQVDADNRLNISSHHTATHLLHHALCHLVGEHVRQAGSLVEENRLRFDFLHHKKLTNEEILEIEKNINDCIRKNITVISEVQEYISLHHNPKIKQFFNEKYDSHVRVVSIPVSETSISRELCGGTHVQTTGQLGLFHIIKTHMIASGVCRVEAIVGQSTETFLRTCTNHLDAMSQLFKSQKHELLDKVQQSLEKTKLLEKEIARINEELIDSLLTRIMKNKEASCHVSGWHLLHHKIEPRWEQELHTFAKVVFAKQQPPDILLLYLDNGSRVQGIIASKKGLPQNMCAKSVLKLFEEKCKGGGAETSCQFTASSSDFEHQLKKVLSCFPPKLC